MASVVYSYIRSAPAPRRPLQPTRQQAGQLQEEGMKRIVGLNGREMRAETEEEKINCLVGLCKALELNTALIADGKWGDQLNLAIEKLRDEAKAAGCYTAEDSGRPKLKGAPVMGAFEDTPEEGGGWTGS